VLRDGAQPGDPAMQLLKYTPSFATRSKAGVEINLQPAKLVCAKDWSSEIANKILGRLSGSSFVLQASNKLVKNSMHTKLAISFFMD
jgi:hypothetical protein